MEEQKANPADHNGVDSAVGGRHVGWYVDDVCGDARRGRIGAYEAGRKVDRLVGVQRHYRPRIHPGHVLRHASRRMGRGGLIYGCRIGAARHKCGFGTPRHVSGRSRGGTATVSCRRIYADVAGRRWTGAGAEAGAGARGARRSQKRQNLVGHTDTAVGNVGKHGPLKASIPMQARHQAVAPFSD